MMDAYLPVATRAKIIYFVIIDLYLIEFMY